jgi:hypothetical protein
MLLQLTMLLILAEGGNKAIFRKNKINACAGMSKQGLILIMILGRKTIHLRRLLQHFSLLFPQVMCTVIKLKS